MLVGDHRSTDRRPAATLRGAGVVTLLVLAAAWPGEGAEGGAVEARDRRRAAGQIAASRLAEFGSWCRTRSYKALAIAQFEEAIRRDPECQPARSALGHRRAMGVWSASTKKTDVIDALLVDPVAVAEVEKQSTEAYSAGAAAFADLASWLESAALPKDALEAWWTCLWFDPAHDGARQSLGLDAASRKWLEVCESGPGVWAERARELARETSRPLPTATAQEDLPALIARRIPYTETREARWVVRCRRVDVSSRELVGVQLEAEALLEGIGLSPVRRKGGAWFGFNEFATREQYRETVDSNPAWSAEEKEFYGSGSWCWWDPCSYVGCSSARDACLDRAAHHGVHFLLRDFPGARQLPPWVIEGMAHLTTTTLLGTARTFCASTGSSGRTSLDEVKNWDEAARALIRKGEDPSLEEIMVARANDLTMDRLIKARSVITWLLTTDPDGFRRLLEALVKSGRPDDAVREVFGCPTPALDRRWRFWARRR